TDVNELSRGRAQNVDPQHVPGLGVDEQFEESGAVARDLATGELAVACEADDVGNRRLGQLALTWAEERDLGDRVDPVWKQVRKSPQRLAEGGERREAALLHRCGRKAGKADDVAGGEDVRLSRAKVGADWDPAALVRFEPRSGEVRGPRRALPARRVENDLRGNQLAAPQPRDDRAVESLDRLDRLAEAEGDTQSAQVVLQRLGDLVVHEIENARPLLDEGHLHTERSGHRGVLEADDAAPDNRDRARNLAQSKHPVRVEDGGVVEVHSCRTRGRRSDRDHVPIGEEATAGPGGMDLQRVRIEERRGSENHVDAVAAQLVANHFSLVLDDRLRAPEQVVDRDLLARAIDALALA